LARRTLEPIEAAHEQQKRFTADVSHELRTPLTALKMESEVALLDKEVTKADLKHTLSSNLEEVAKLEALINNLLRLSQLENTQIREHFVATDLRELAADASATLLLVAKKRHITVASDLHKVNVLGDSVLITQLITIILDNAIKYSLPKSIVRITTRKNGNNAQLIIVDEGIGIEPDALPHIFDRFYRADKARNKTDSQGYGLGLSLAKMITDLHRGSIHITSLSKQGTTVTVNLPLAPVIKASPDIAAA
jgi:signal transduction histidine kinase